MKAKIEYNEERREAARYLERLNRLAVIHFAEVLRAHDTYQRICREAGFLPSAIVPQHYFEIAYKLLTFGTFGDRATLMLGTVEEIEKLVERVQRSNGFYDEKGFFIEI